MPNERQHIQWALHNIDVLSHLQTNPLYCDWTATVAFYTALHIVDAVFFKDAPPHAKHGGDHKRRQAVLKQTTKYKAIHDHYYPLADASHIARYIQKSGGGAISFQSYMNAQKVRDELIQHRLTHVMKSAMKFLSKDSVEELDNALKNLP